MLPTHNTSHHTACKASEGTQSAVRIMSATTHAMQAHGTLFLSKQRPQVGTAADGVFQLQLLAMDRQGTHQVEPWRLTWAGAEAAAFWRNHQGAMTPGAVLQVQAERLRPHNTRLAAEVHARVLSMRVVRAGAAVAETAQA